MLKTILLFVSVNAITVILSGLSVAQISEQKARESISANECIKSLASDPKLLRIVRKEDLEDEIFALQKKIRGNILKKTIIFEVSKEGYFVTSPDEVVIVSSTGIRHILVAVSVVKQEVFTLYGCADAEENFVKLISETGVNISSISDAEQFALLRYTFVEDTKRRRWITHKRQLRHEAEDYFFDTFPHTKAELMFKSWLRDFNKLSLKLELGVRARDGGDHYSTSVTYFNRSKKGGFDLLQTNLIVSRNGEFQLKRLKTLL